TGDFMKKILAIIVVLTVSMAVAQTQAPAPAAPAKPGAQAGTPAAPAGPTQATTGGKKPLQFKTQDEQAAYMALLKVQDPAAAETAANEFVVKYPASDMRGAAYQAVMNL